MNAMMQAVLLVFLAATAADASRWGGRRSQLSLSRAEPSGVAKILVEVEQRWEQWALMTADCGEHPMANCTTNATTAKADFAQSCATVSRAVIQSSAGDKTRVQSYMADVCQSDALKGDKAELCLDYAQMLAQGMSEYQHENTAADGGLDLPSMCLDLFEHGYLGTKISQEADRRKAESDARAAEEQQKADAAEAARRQVEADAKAAEARKHLEEVANATAVATKKREAAVRAAVEAQRKAEEVEQAEAVQKHLQEEAKAAEKEANAAAANVTTKPAVHRANSSSFVAVRKSFLAAFPITFS